LDVRFGPKADSCGAAKELFDHLVGAHQDRRRRLEPDHLSGLEVDDEIKFCGLLDWKIGQVGSAQHFGDLMGYLPIELVKARTIPYSCESAVMAGFPVRRLR
jgi:hypothetical protein